MVFPLPSTTRNSPDCSSWRITFRASDRTLRRALRAEVGKHRAMISSSVNGGYRSGLLTWVQ